jgi:hypothetical protein
MSWVASGMPTNHSAFWPVRSITWAQPVIAIFYPEKEKFWDETQRK